MSLELESFLNNLCKFGIELACRDVPSSFAKHIALWFETALLLGGVFCECVADRGCLSGILDMHEDLASLSSYEWRKIRKIDVDYVKRVSMCIKEK